MATLIFGQAFSQELTEKDILNMVEKESEQKISCSVFCFDTIRIQLLCRKIAAKLLMINIYSSVSTVPTKTCETNEKLSALRAENIKYDIMTYFQSNMSFNEKIVLTITGSATSGPAYQNDAGNRKKYRA